MEIFYGLGQAVAGIFITVLLSGILAGIVAYGLIEKWFREQTQRNVVTTLLQREYAEPPERERSKEKTEDAGARRLMSLLDLDDSDFYSLPYRQLCGLLAARVSADVAAAAATSAAADAEAAAAVKTATESAASEDAPKSVARVLAAHMKPLSVTPEPPTIRKDAERALAFVDKLQVKLAEAVASRAFNISTVIVTLIFTGLFIPAANALQIFNESSYLLVRSFGMMVSLTIAVLILGCLAFGSVIVASLTFRWIDRLASAR